MLDFLKLEVSCLAAMVKSLWFISDFQRRQIDSTYEDFFQSCKFYDAYMCCKHDKLLFSEKTEKRLKNEILKKKIAVENILTYFLDLEEQLKQKLVSEFEGHINGFNFATATRTQLSALKLSRKLLYMRNGYASPTKDDQNFVYLCLFLMFLMASEPNDGTRNSK